MNTRKDIQDLAETRLGEAKVLYKSAYYDGTIYLAGYSVELALKAAICKNLDVDDFFAPNNNPFFSASKSFKIHDLKTLLLYAGLHTKLSDATARNVTLKTHWSLVVTWSEQMRYQSLAKKIAQQAAKDFLFATEDPTNGVLQWIQKYW